MKNRIYALLLAFLPLLTFAQSVPFPSGQGRDYNAIEPYGYEDVNTNWDTSPYLPFIYHGIWFRMMLPNGVTWNAQTKTFSNANPGQKYPLILFFHGRGEVGTDNNRQLTHGGEIHKNAVLNGTFPGFLVYPQSVGYEGGKDVLEKLLTQLPIDINRIYVHGLSNGGQETWKFIIANPQLVAAAFPMSAADLNGRTNNLLYTPLRESQGELDTNPSLSYAQQVKDWYDTNGGHLEFFVLPNTGHSTWNPMYNRPDFFSWFLSHKKNEIMVRYDRNLVCPDAPANVVMGFTPGMQAYEWRKDGVLMSGQTGNSITATTFGSYTGRFRYRNVWTDWSDPVVVGPRPATVTPNITVVGSSLYIPDVNGTSAVNLSLPAGYATYRWYRQGESEPVGTTQNITVSRSGTYTAVVTETGGCPTVPSIPSPGVTVIDATGAAPDAPANLQAAGASLTSIKLTWENNPTPVVNETAFEIFRANQSGGPYALVATVPTDVLTYTDINLTQNFWYYYKVRAVSANGASSATDEVAGLTQVDSTPPTPPNGVTAANTGTTANPGIRITWPANASTDAVGVVAYEIWQKEWPNGNYQKAFNVAPSNSTTNFTISNLPVGFYYTFVVKARDAAGNVSGPSTEVFRNASYSVGGTTGLAYKYYKTNAQNAWTVIPNFDNINATTSGFMSNFTLTIPSGQPSDYFGFRWDGAIMIQSAATYTFFLLNGNDEGSRLYINGQLVVNCDGPSTNNGTEKSGTIALQPGYYPIRVEYFERSSSQSLSVKWQASSLGIAKGTIPNANLIRNYNDVAGQIPLPPAPGSVVPANLSAVAPNHNTINLSWQYAGHGTQLEIYTSPNNSTWKLLTTVNVGTTTFQHTDLNANTRYYYRMRATNVVGQGSYSSSVNTTTKTLPPVPTAPTNLVVTGVTATSATLDWLDKANNETNYDIYKSTPDNAHYTKLITLPENTVHHVDNTLFAHTTYYYKVQAKNVTGTSAFSNQVQITTANTAPVLNTIANQVVRHSGTYSIPITATDADGDLIIMGSTTMPSFAQLFDYGDGTGEIILSPEIDDIGTYPDIEVFAEDLYGGRVTRTFNVTVNSNYTPVVSNPGPLSVKETYKQVVNITATDGDSDPIQWTIGELPAFVGATINGNTVQVTIEPGLNDAGSYNLTFTAKDPAEASATVVVPLTVTNYNPNFQVFVNFRPNAGNDDTIAESPWNNLSLGVTNLSLNDQNGAATGFSIQAPGNWQAGVSGITPGVYPNPVNLSYYFFQMGSGTDSRTITLSGLNPNGKYNIKLLASRKIEDSNNRTTVYTIGGVSQQINANGNANTTVDFNGLTPAANGTIAIRLAGSVANGYALINALVLESFYSGTTPPAAPSSLGLTILNEQVKLTWVDNADNETAFEVYRSVDNTNFTKVGQTTADVTTFTDVNLVSGVTYYYKVLSKNGIGSSDFSNVATVLGPNHAPVIPALETIQVAEEDMKWVMIYASDADNDAMTFDLVDAPDFVWLEYAGTSATSLVMTPFPGDAGDFFFKVAATDVHGAVTLVDVHIYVGFPDENVVKINFTQGGVTAGSPWANITTFNNGTVTSGLRNQFNSPTSMTLTIGTGWVTFNNTGYTTGNNSGIYPDNVLRTSVYTQTTGSLVLGGLSPSKTYEFTFFASRDNVQDTRNTTYNIGAKSAVLNAANNHDNVVKITSVKPNTSGQITITATKGESGFGYLGALIVREYTAPNVPTPPSAPLNLASVVTSRTSVRLNWTDGSDNETGFEVWRSVGNNLNYTLVTTLGANVTTYNNTSLSSATTYYYKVRAINAVGQSAYSNQSTSTTYNYSISINFNSAGGYTQTNWNNIGSWNGDDGWVFSSNLVDDTNTGTQVTATAIKAFGGQNFAGMQTGNNSGIVPDKVMKQSWFVDKGTTAQIRFANLNLLKKYNFAFFGSRDDTTDPATRITHYTIGSTTVTLDCSKNTQNLAQIQDVIPNSDGTITVTVYAPVASAYGYLNAMIIQAIPNPNARIAADDEIAGNTSIFESNEVQAYPNPFEDRITLKFTKGGRFQARMLSINGIPAFHGEFDAEDGQEVELPVSADLAPGVYIMNVIESKGAAQTIKLLKK